MEWNNKLKPKPVKKPNLELPKGKKSVYEGNYDKEEMAEFAEQLKKLGINWEWDQRLTKGIKKPNSIIIDEDRWEDLKNLHRTFVSTKQLKRNEREEKRRKREEYVKPDPKQAKEAGEQYLQSKQLVLLNTDDSELSENDRNIKQYIKDKQEEAKVASEVYDMYDWAEDYYDRWAIEAFEYNNENESGIDDDEYVLKKGEELVKAIAGRSDKKYSPEQLEQFLEYLRMNVYSRQGAIIKMPYDIEAMRKAGWPQDKINVYIQKNETTKKMKEKYDEMYERELAKRKFKGN